MVRPRLLQAHRAQRAAWDGNDTQQPVLEAGQGAAGLPGPQLDRVAGGIGLHQERHEMQTSTAARSTVVGGMLQMLAYRHM